ncbi:MAG: PEP-CTERM sorting domain-containing protein [Planctomycetota bacterium]
MNDLSGINIVDTWNALSAASPVAGSQFMFTTLAPAGAPASAVLDVTPGSIIQPQDWDFNAFAGPGNFEWDISPGASAGVVVGQPPAIFGYAMPGTWQDRINTGWVHSWNQPAPNTTQVNITPTVPGFSGPRIPEPASLVLVGAGLLALLRRRRKT